MNSKATLQAAAELRSDLRAAGITANLSSEGRAKCDVITVWIKDRLASRAKAEELAAKYRIEGGPRPRQVIISGGDKSS